MSDVVSSRVCIYWTPLLFSCGQNISKNILGWSSNTLDGYAIREMGTDPRERILNIALCVAVPSLSSYPTRTHA